MIIITGASKGIGRFLFTRFKEMNEKLIGTFHSTFAGFESDKGDYYQVDISDYNSVRNFIRLIQNCLQNIILINCAGISYNAFAHKSEMEKWEKVIDVNVKGTFYMIRELLPMMREQNFGRIINFSSVVTQLPAPGISAYAASKSALLGLTKSLAVENGSKGITVNAINLGYVNLGMGINDVPEAYQEKMKNRIPSGRFCEPEEIYQTIQYLIKTEYVNGTAINISGGLI